jgi:hypothetical protein
MFYWVPIAASEVPPRRPPMPIRPYLAGEKFDPETIRVMGVAFEMALVALRLADRGDLANEILARKIIDLARAGERNSERLCDGVLKEFRAPPPSAARPSALWGRACLRTKAYWWPLAKAASPRVSVTCQVSESRGGAG